MAAHDDSVRTKPRRIGLVLFGVLLVGALACTVYFYKAYRKAVAANPMTQQQSLVSQLNSLVIAPSEQPQIATVKDASKLTSSVLASKTKNGDVLFVYNKAGEIIVYRPSVHKVVNMLTVQASGQDSSDTAQNSTATSGSSSQASSSAKTTKP